MVREYAPDLVLVSAGFDAAPGDTGECQVTPECFGRLTQSLMSISNGKVVCSLEGGYVRSVLGECVLCVVEALLKRNDNDDFSDLVDLDHIESSAAASIQATLTAHASYWKCFQRDC
jgi:acetoin utilization deacetylase AcuC-like enzyme